MACEVILPRKQKRGEITKFISAICLNMFTEVVLKMNIFKDNLFSPFTPTCKRVWNTNFDFTQTE